MKERTDKQQTKRQSDVKPTHRLVYHWQKVKSTDNKVFLVVQQGIFDSITKVLSNAHKVSSQEFKGEDDCAVYQVGTKEECTKQLAKINEGNLPDFDKIKQFAIQKLRFIPLKKKLSVSKVEPTKFEELQSKLLLLGVYIEVYVEKIPK